MIDPMEALQVLGWLPILGAIGFVLIVQAREKRDDES